MTDLGARLMAGYDVGYDRNGFSGARLAERLAQVSQIGLTDAGGSHRLGFSAAERAAKDLVIGWLKQLGFTVKMDAAGNCFGRLAGRNGAAPSVMCGSHIDTVPNGGHFDGALGVLLAVEVAEMWRATGFTPESPYEVAIFSDEEGTRFNVGFVGSTAMVGSVDIPALAALEDCDGHSFATAVAETGLVLERFGDAHRDAATTSAFVEVHIEQGCVLERENAAVGIVSAIAGLYGLEITVTGVAGHAGTTPMTLRQDALVGAARIVSAISEIAPQCSDTAVATVGQLIVFPGGANVIPGKVRFTVDLRDISQDTLDLLHDRIIARATEIAAEAGLDLRCGLTLSVPPTYVDEGLKAMQRAALHDIGAPLVEIPSGAGHDAMIIGNQIPVAMFFVRSKDGISHNPVEYTSLDDCAIAAQALSGMLKKLLTGDPARERKSDV